MTAEPHTARDWSPARDLREMHRAIDQPEGVRKLLNWLACRLDGWAVLLDRSGRPMHALPHVPGYLINKADGDIRRVRTRRADSAIVEFGPHSIHLLAADTDRPGAVLLVAMDGRPASDASPLIAEAARLLRLRIRVERAEGRRRAIEEAEWRLREAVLHLLMAGDHGNARRVAAALRPELPDPVRVCVVECPATIRDEIAIRCLEASDGAWVVRCPVYEAHVIVLAPPEPKICTALRELARSRADIQVGASGVVSLQETATGYGQAFHAIAGARDGDSRFAIFDPRVELTHVLGPDARAWARTELAAVIDHVPERRQDPSAHDLLVTLRSWLDFYGGAARQLKLHRNTVSARLRRIEGLIGGDLGDLRTQARLHLALRIMADAQPYRTQGDVPSPAPFDSRHARRWAETTLAPLRDEFIPTLRAWLDANARLEETAATLGISVAGARKRLLRMEQSLGRSLLSGPSARYDLWFALRIDDGTGPDI